MHPTAEDGFVRMLRASRARQEHSYPSRVLDIGGADVNGTVHQCLRSYGRRDEMTIDVLDIADGPGVTIVADAEDWATWDRLVAGEPYDLVICTEVFEHVRGWHTIVCGAHKVLRVGGWFIGTCAGVDRRPHGARGEHEVPDGEWYLHVDADDLIHSLTRTFSGEVVVEYSQRPTFPTTSDLYWRAERVAPRDEAV